jgi:phosphoribosylformimino-5-aminoimidazole carboxamide ribonucleotide (ProFAR) isomerase
VKVWAAIDVRGGAAVQLVGGDPSDERVRLPDPAAVAERWLDAGFSHLHVVDLDAALGSGRNDEAVAAIVATIRARRHAAERGSGQLAPGATATARDRGGTAAVGTTASSLNPVLQVGGGLRGDEAVARALELGSDRAVVGTRAVEDRGWLETAADRWPDRLVVAADIRDGEVVTRGWTEGTGREAAVFVAGLDVLPLAGILVTDVGREGRQGGVDGGLFAELVAATRHPVIAAGGVGGPDDLDTLSAAGAAGAVLGMALYTGRMQPAEALEREDP